MFVTPEELLAGKDVTYDVDIPAELLHPTPDGRPASGASAGRIRLRPLTVKDIQLIAKAAKDDEVLTSVLMIQRADLGNADGSDIRREFQAAAVGTLEND